MLRSWVVLLLDRTCLRVKLVPLPPSHSNALPLVSYDVPLIDSIDGCPGVSETANLTVGCARSGGDLITLSGMYGLLTYSSV